MSRVPSYDAQALESQIGPRGSVVVTSDNRALVQNWCVAQGIPSATVKSMRLETLGKCYNVDSYLRAVIANRGPLPEAGGEHVPNAQQGQGGEAQQNEPMPAFDLFQDDPNGQPKPQPNDAGKQSPIGDQVRQGYRQARAERVKQLAEQLAREAGGLSPEDEQRIVELIKQHAPQSPNEPRVLEIRRPDAPPVQIEEHTHPAFERVLKLLMAGANVLLVGPAGCGKTHMAEQLAKAMGRNYGAIHGSAGASESALTGWRLPSDGGRFEYTPAPFVTLYESGESLFLFDELDAFDPNMLLVVNGALANGSLWIAHRTEAPRVQRGANVAIMATSNTYGTGANPMYSGRQPLDAATLDRFIPVTMDYDTKYEDELGASLGMDKAQRAAIWDLRKRVREAGLRRVISTRAFQKAGQCLVAGDSWPTVMATLVEGWSRDEKAKAGVAQ